MLPSMSKSMLSRRRFLSCGLAGGATLLVSRLYHGKADMPLCRFVQTNDLHVQADGAPQQTYQRANEKARWLVDALRRHAFGPPIGFVVGVGDLIHGGSLERLAPDLEMLRKVLKPLPHPFYPVIGNHEVVQQERSPEYLQPFIGSFGRKRLDYTFVSKGILFVALNNSGVPSPKAAILRNAWLRRVFSENAPRPKIICCYIPLIPLRERDTLAKSFGFASYCDQDPGTLKLVEQHADTVIAVLSGHLHLTGMRILKEICHFSLSGTASYPSDGAAIFEVFPDRLEVSVKQLPEELAHATTSLHGRPRHEQDYVDAEHTSAEAYQCGTPAERGFALPLAGTKRPST